MQCHINKEAAEISALPSCKIDKYEWLTVEEILPSDERGIIGKTRFTNSLLRKPL